MSPIELESITIIFEDFDEKQSVSDSQIDNVSNNNSTTLQDGINSTSSLKISDVFSAVHSRTSSPPFTPRIKHDYVLNSPSIKNEYDAFYQAGTLAQHNGDVENAINYFEECVQLNPDNLKVYGQIANLYRQVENYLMYALYSHKATALDCREP